MNFLFEKILQYRICAMLLKEKYYPNGELVDKLFPGNASPTWRSIEYGL
jgi:hypothetical protein